jgi:hypothetical protein
MLSLFWLAAIVPQMLNTWNLWILAGWLIFGSFIFIAIWTVNVKERT